MALVAWRQQWVAAKALVHQLSRFHIGL